MESEEEQGELCEVIDLTEHRLKKYVDTFYQDTPEWDVAMQILYMYISDEIDVAWTNDGIIVEHPKSEQRKEWMTGSLGPTRVILPLSGPNYNPIKGQ
jgi:hypothetical protein